MKFYDWILHKWIDEAELEEAKKEGHDISIHDDDFDPIEWLNSEDIIKSLKCPVHDIISIWKWHPEKGFIRLCCWEKKENESI